MGGGKSSNKRLDIHVGIHVNEEAGIPRVQGLHCTSQLPGVFMGRDKVGDAYLLS